MATLYEDGDEEALHSFAIEALARGNASTGWPRKAVYERELAWRKAGARVKTV